MVRPKPKSKRTPVRLRHKIEKAGAAKQRKQRKASKANPEWRSRLKKDPGIPNLFPYKEKLLHEIEENRRKKEEAILRKREEAKELKRRSNANDDAEDGAEEMDVEEEHRVGEEAADEDMEVDDSANPMAALLASAKARAVEYEDENGPDDGGDLEDSGSEGDDDDDDDVDGGVTLGLTASTPKETSRRSFDKVFKSVIDRADVILYVLDARNPASTRSPETERLVTASPHKRLILLLNKIDLVPPPVLAGWLAHLRRSFPTLPVLASRPAPGAQTFNHRHLTVSNTSSALFKALKAYAASSQLKRAVTVGVIGYPNVGKSSVINALLARLGGGSGSGSTAACPTGAEAGVTTSLREIKLDGKLKLLDSPGIVFPSSSSSRTSTSTDSGPSSSSKSRASRADEQARLVLLNAIPPKQITDPVPAVALLLARLASSPDLLAKLLEVYGIPALMPPDGSSSITDQTTSFLIQVARKRGRLGKGGVPNLASAAAAVLADWRDGRVAGWVEPPKLKIVGSGVDDGEGEVHGEGVEREGAGEVGKGMEHWEGADRKEIVREWAREFRIEGLWGDVDGVEAGEKAGQGVEVGMEGVES